MKLQWIKRWGGLPAEPEEVVVDHLLVVTAAEDDFVAELSEAALLADPTKRLTRAFICVGDIQIHIEGGRVSVAGGTVATSGPMYFDRRR